jgi:hypothetical protein
LTGKGAPRHFFAVKGDVGEAFAQVAERRNITLYSLLNDVLAKVNSLDKAGGSLGEAIDSFHVIRTIKEIGFVVIPEDLWYETVENSLKADRKATTARFSAAGEWIGKYCLAKNRGGNTTQELTSCLAPLSSNANDFSLEGSDAVRLRCVNPRFSQSYAESFSVLLSKAFETIGHEITSRTVSKGMIILTLRKVSKPGQKVRDEILA